MKINSSNGSTPTSEIDYLTELILDFPAETIISTAKAFELLRTRYESLEKNIPQFLLLISSSFPPKSLFPFRKLFIEDDRLPAHFYVICRKSHFFLYNGILNNAGQFRKSTDPNAGVIGFGGFNRRKIGNFRFTGSNPLTIVEELCHAFLLLRNKSNNPLKDGLEFYRRFVKIHPFYDANGRIARLILSIYLLHHDLYVNWRGIEKGGGKNKFLRKLNACHDREDQPNYPQYLNYLFEFFKKFVLSGSSLK